MRIAGFGNSKYPPLRRHSHWHPGLVGGRNRFRNRFDPPDQPFFWSSSPAPEPEPLSFRYRALKQEPGIDMWYRHLMRFGMAHRHFPRLHFLLLLLGLAPCFAGEQPEIACGLVRAATIYPPPLEEVRYATTYNFTGHVMYPFPAVFLHQDAAAALQQVQEELSSQGLGLKIYDGYRPLSVQAKMWQIVPDERYVSDPLKSQGKHTRGTAVDVTLVDYLGNELRMPTPYDSFTEKAHRDSEKWTSAESANSRKLEAAMKKYGFVPFLYEWWHYDLADWQNYPPLDISFEDLARGEPLTKAVP